MAAYDYLFLTLARGRPAHTRLAEALPGALGARELVGQFSPQLGWASNEAAVLLRGSDEEPARAAALDAVAALPDVLALRREQLTPTLRPAEQDRPPPGGIFVHNWFHVDAEATEEFVRLSGEAWVDFEGRFETTIFGLFTAARSADDQAQGVQRLLLITRYADHGVWEASRDPSSAAMKIFARRHELTRHTRACSTLLRA